MQIETHRPVSMTAQAAWSDLRRLLQEADAVDLRGTPKRKTVRGKKYWFDQYRLGQKVVETYIGEDTPDRRRLMEDLRTVRARAKDAERARSRLTRLLRAEGFLRPDLATGQLLTAMARAGTFRLGGTLVGTQAFRHYEGVLGIHLGLDDAAVTQDIDIASFERLSLALNTMGDSVDPGMDTLFGALEFEAVPSLDRDRVWRWKHSRQQMLVEFLTPSFQEDEGLRTLPALGVSAQSLHFLNYLIAAPIPVPLLYRSGALIQVPRPERFAIHKLIVAARRREGSDGIKARKDRAQADLLIRHLSDEDPDALKEAYDDAMERGPSWRSKIGESLTRLRGAAARLDAL